MCILIYFFAFAMQRYGCSIWRKDTVINTAEKKILLLLFTVGCVATINGVNNMIRLHTKTKHQTVFTHMSNHPTDSQLSGVQSKVTKDYQGWHYPTLG